jgi:ubiquinone/menaquinone biosynthesis C-methylase UbiE/DNA-binding transcriptional ArsR family regulator
VRVPQLSNLVSVLKAASEITRLRILALLTRGELSVKDITDILAQSQPRVSRHLKLLSDVGLIERYAEGAWAYFRLGDTLQAQRLVQDILSLLDGDDPVIAADLEKLQQVRVVQADAAAQYFGTVAQSWDVLRSLHVLESEIEAAIIAFAALRKRSKVLDLGTGTGRMLELLAGHYKLGIGVDSSREMIAVARAKLSNAQIRHAQIRLGDIAEPIVGGGDADLVILHQVLHYFDDPSRVLNNARQALGPGGEILVVDFAPHSLEFLRSEHAHRRLGLSEPLMSNWAKQCDLEVQQMTTFPNPNVANGLTVCLWVLGQS